VQNDNESAGIFLEGGGNMEQVRATATVDRQGLTGSSLLCVAALADSVAAPAGSPTRAQRDGN
jgi:hypothetical protein